MSILITVTHRTERDRYVVTATVTTTRNGGRIIVKETTLPSEEIAKEREPSSTSNGESDGQKSATPKTQSAVRREPRIVAFLQNPWFREGTPQYLIDKYRENAEFRMRVLSATATGKILMKMLGSLYSKIHWNNANPNHGFERDHREPPDPVHMAHVIVDQDPDLVLCFGQAAQHGMVQVLSIIDVTVRPRDNVIITPGKKAIMNFPHPQARGIPASQWDRYSKQVFEFINKKV